MEETYSEFFDNLKIENGSKYIGKKFNDVFPFLSNKKLPVYYRNEVSQYNGILNRLEKNIYSSISMRQRDLNKLDRIKTNIDKKKYLANFYLDSKGTIIDFKENYSNGGKIKGLTTKLLAPNGKPSNLTPKQYKLVRTPEFKAWFGDWENDSKNASKVVDENGEPLVVWHGTKKGSQLYVFLEKQDSGSHFGTKKSAIDRRQDTGDFDYELIPCFLKINKPLFVDEDMNWESEMYSDMDYGEPIYRSFTDWAEKKGLDIYYRGDGIVVNEDMLPKGFYVKFNDKYKRYIVYDELGVFAGGDTKTQSIEHALSMLGKKITKPNGIKTLKELINDNGYDGIFYVNEIEDKGNLSYLVIEPNKIKLADGTNTTFDSNNPNIRFDGGGQLNNRIIEISKSVVLELGETYSKNEFVGKCKEISEEIGKRLNEIDIDAIPMRIIDGEDKQYKSPVFNHAYTFLPKTNQIIDTQLWQLQGKPNNLKSRKILFTWKEYNDIVELYDVEPISEFENNKFGYNPNIRYSDGGLIFNENDDIKIGLRAKDKNFVFYNGVSIGSFGIRYLGDVELKDAINFLLGEVESVNNISLKKCAIFETGFVINKEYRNRGYGRKIIKKLFDNYKIDNILLYAFYEQEAVGFWQKMGGQVVYDDGDVVFLLLKKDTYIKTNIHKMGGKIKGGDCYYIAGQFTMGVFSPKKIDYIGTPYLVHAEVQGQGHISHIRYGHAWIEDDINVYDFSNNRELIIPKLLYYAIGDIKTDNPKKYRKYTFQEARKKMVDTKHYGCWDLEVDYANGGTINEKPNYRFYKATINNKDIFPVKISTKDERHSDMLNMFNELHERGYILKEITKEEFENFDYSNVSKKDIQDFMSGLSYYEIGGTIVNSKNKNNVVPLFIDTEGRLELREDKNGNYANNWEFYTSPKIINSLLRYFKIPIKAVKKLGTGSYGVAFLTDKKKVLKITNNANEAYTSFVIMKNKSKLKTQAEVYNVFKITNGASLEDSLYLIEKQLVPEVLSDVVNEIEQEYDWDIDGNPEYRISIYEYFQSLIGQLDRYHINNEIKKIRDFDVYEFLMEKRYEMDSPNKRGDAIVIYYANKIKEFYLELGKDEAKTDLDFSDVHSGNAGFLNKKFVCFDCAMGNVSLFNIGGIVSKSKLFIPNVRGGWTKNKIIKYLKNKSSDYISTLKLLKYISEFDNWQQFKDHIYYHGTQNYIERGLTPSITMSEREVERIGGGGYGQRYFGVSLTKRKRTAESFSGMSSSVTIYPVILKRDANVIERTDLQDAADIEDIIVELYEKGVDAVWIGGGEEELVVINPYSILLYKNGREHHNVYGGFKSIPLTDEKIKEIYDNSYNLFEKYSEEYKSKQSKEERENFIKSIPKIQFELGGEITLTYEQVEQKLGRKLNWWKDNVVSINGIEYKKVFLKNEYNLL